MYYYGGGSSCGCSQQTYQTPYYCGCSGNGNSAYAIVLVLFILLVIVLGCRFGN
ncbi:MAG: sporulation protein YjcZ [Mycoplasmatota bacterium]|nr:sporulation protein YjcZ [Mycoplasmatota bacterium]